MIRPRYRNGHSIGRSFRIARPTAERPEGNMDEQAISYQSTHNASVSGIMRIIQVNPSQGNNRASPGSAQEPTFVSDSVQLKLTPQNHPRYQEASIKVICVLDVIFFLFCHLYQASYHPRSSLPHPISRPTIVLVPGAWVGVPAKTPLSP